MSKAARWSTSTPRRPAWPSESSRSGCGWVQQYTETLAALVAELEARWAADGRMADGALRADEK